MARKSSKTAHVMNLLAGDEPESSKSEAAKVNQAASLNTDSSETIKELTVLAHKASIQTQEGPLTPSPISIIDMSSASPDPVSEMIRQQLEEEEGIILTSSQEEVAEGNTIEDEVTEELESKEDNNEPYSGEVSSEEGVVEEAEAEEIEAEGLAAEEPLSEELNTEEDENQEKIENVNEEKEEAPIMLTASEVKVIETDFEEPEKNLPAKPKSVSDKESTSAPESEKPTFKYLNVMEHVVQSMVNEYAAKFDICCCGHCIADITALTLSNLPPKYIVVEPPSASPLLNFYINRYSQQVIVELTKSCIMVKKNPHH